MSTLHDHRPPNLRWYDWIVINSSAGKDSQAMTDVVVEAVRAAGLDPAQRVVVAHCDLARVEWQGTPELAEEHAAHYGLRFLKVHRTQGDLLQHVEERGKWPSPTNRYCTSDHKRAQIYRIITALALRQRSQGKARTGAFHLPPDFGTSDKDYYWGRPVRVLSVMGLRADESPARAKMPMFQRVKENTNVVMDEWLPIHGWNVDQVWERIKAAGTRHHPAYDVGMPRLSCAFCIYAPKAALRIAAVHNTDLLREYVRVERKINHKFRVDYSLEELLAELEAGEINIEKVDAKAWVG